ncbi:hypothetical protein LEMLEM_LOCUS27749, partial [Lemmus lemmus]
MSPLMPLGAHPRRSSARHSTENHSCVLSSFLSNLKCYSHSEVSAGAVPCS